VDDKTLIDNVYLKEGLVQDIVSRFAEHFRILAESSIEAEEAEISSPDANSCVKQEPRKEEHPARRG
jgi:hypothetical protein